MKVIIFFQSRASIFNVHLKNIKTDDGKADLAQKLAALTLGFTGADIASLCKDAGLSPPFSLTSVSQPA